MEIETLQQANPAPAVQRRFIKVGEREVHYLRSGEGPPLVLIHASPYNASAWLQAMAQWSRHFTCFAFDSPGFGLSDPLPPERMNVFDMADAAAETMRVAGLSNCRVVGSHTGAAIALELALRHPELVSGVVLEGLPVFLESELAEWFTDEYFASLKVSEHGEHLSWAWTRVRDCDLWFPWVRRVPENFYSNGRGSAEKLHSDVMDFFLCADHYKPAYRSAVFYRDAARALSRIDQPALITASSADLMFPHMDRLGDLKPEQQLLKLGPEPQAFLDAVEEALLRFPGSPVAPCDVDGMTPAAGVARHFVDIAEGRILVRYAGSGSGDPIVLLHDLPGSALELEPFVRALSGFGRVIAIELPGCGESALLRQEHPSAGDYADSIARVCATLGFDRIRLYGLGFGSSIALALKSRHPELVRRMALHGVFLPGDAERAELRANYAPPITVKANGSHWYDVWLMLRDSLTQWPWYDGRRSAMRQIVETRDAAALHRWTVEVMKQPLGYAQAIAAAIDFNAAQALESAAGPLLLCLDERHRFAAHASLLERLAGDAERIEVAPDGSGFAAGLGAWLSQ